MHNKGAMYAEIIEDHMVAIPLPMGDDDDEDDYYPSKISPDGSDAHVKWLGQERRVLVLVAGLIIALFGAFVFAAIAWMPDDPSTTSTTLSWGEGSDSSQQQQPQQHQQLRSSTRTKSPIAAASSGCLMTDRLDNENMDQNNRLYPGQFICSSDESQRFRFGLTLSGDLVFEDTLESSVRTLYEGPSQQQQQQQQQSSQELEHKQEDSSSFFSLRTDGTFVIHRSDEGSSWELPPKESMDLSEGCLEDHDCPYLHLHRDGVMVLNWMGEKGTQWHERNFLEVYAFDGTN